MKGLLKTRGKKRKRNGVPKTLPDDLADALCAKLTDHREPAEPSAKNIMGHKAEEIFCVNAAYCLFWPHGHGPRLHSGAATGRGCVKTLSKENNAGPVVPRQRKLSSRRGCHRQSRRHGGRHSH